MKLRSVGLGLATAMLCPAPRRAFRTLVKTLAVALFVAMATGRCEANLVFEFQRNNPSHDVLARLTFDSLPADHTNIVSLEFTSAGDAIFGLGVGPYAGAFNASASQFVQGADGTLEGTNPAFGDYSAVAYSDAAPLSSLLPPLDGGDSWAPKLRIVVFRFAWADTIYYEAKSTLNPGEGGPFFGTQASGEWFPVSLSAVPEPTSMQLALGGVLACLSVGALRRRVASRFHR